MIAIGIVAITMTGFTLTIYGANQNSTDPMLQQQALAIADAYMEEALTHPLTDPQGSDTGTCEEANRNEYDDLNDYNCIADTGGAINQFGLAIAELRGYNVTMRVIATTLQTQPAQQVDVLVTHVLDNSVQLRLVSYRVDL